MHRFVAALLLAALSPLGGGCGHLRAQTFSEPDMAPYRQRGSGRIVGDAWWITPNGEKRLPAGAEVVLTPDTPYLREELTYYILSQRRFPQLDPQAVQIHRRCDEYGHFEFSDLPAGYYFVSAVYKWQRPDAWNGRLYEASRVAAKRVTLSGYETATIKLD